MKKYVLATIATPTDAQTNDTLFGNKGGTLNGVLSIAGWLGIGAPERPLPA